MSDRWDAISEPTNPKASEPGPAREIDWVENLNSSPIPGPARRPVFMQWVWFSIVTIVSMASGFTGYKCVQINEVAEVESSAEGRYLSWGALSAQRMLSKAAKFRESKAMAGEQSTETTGLERSAIKLLQQCVEYAAVRSGEGVSNEYLPKKDWDVACKLGTNDINQEGLAVYKEQLSIALKIAQKGCKPENGEANRRWTVGDTEESWRGFFDPPVRSTGSMGGFCILCIMSFIVCGISFIGAICLLGEIRERTSQ